MKNLPDLILLHGALGSQAQFAPLKQALQDHFTIYTYDLEGHGGNPIPEKYSIDSFEKELIQFMDQHGLKNIPVFGINHIQITTPHIVRNIGIILAIVGHSIPRTQIYRPIFTFKSRMKNKSV